MERIRPVVTQLKFALYYTRIIGQYIISFLYKIYVIYVESKHRNNNK